MDYLNRRFFYKYHGAIYISFWIIILICYVLKNTLLELILKFFSLFKKDDIDKIDEAYSTDFYKEILIKPLKDIYQKAITEQKDH